MPDLFSPGWKSMVIVLLTGAVELLRIVAPFPYPPRWWSPDAPGFPLCDGGLGQRASFPSKRAVFFLCHAPLGPESRDI